MKQFFTYTFYAKKTFRCLLLLLILLVALPIIEVPQAEAQTNKTGNFFTRRFTRKNKFQKKSKNKTAFKRKPFKCSEVGKQKIEQIKVSRKQLRRWEEERLVKAEQEKAKEQRQAKNNTINTDENILLSASSENDMEEIVSQKNNTIKKDTEITITKEEENTERAGWYSSKKPDAPKISPIKVSQKNEILNKAELEIAAKHARLGYTIVLEANNKKQLQTVKNYLISIGTQNEAIKINTSEIINQDEIIIKIEK
ncbi:hypothetical protein Fleli_1108 [Bernardetia litoralis DSM 6794]|uniref:Uncharacterized protein n=1 Tax=Bernardetia litoralis (strain ATCC 23117 / DSM 6794 / NBRC 15988 / NCIMB 1366 / Fx l1 / Sio-4) TaxID=880071 RepID=I4AHW1_BERLS|nr:hypothetical protein [Bernardetia litoralis]AFM03546.1 hypothetical protein Fleli_1108 [Bernardetia litoralis DSM 6794]